MPLNCQSFGCGVLMVWQLVGLEPVVPKSVWILNRIVLRYLPVLGVTLLFAGTCICKSSTATHFHSKAYLFISMCSSTLEKAAMCTNTCCHVNTIAVSEVGLHPYLDTNPTFHKTANFGESGGTLNLSRMQKVFFSPKHCVFEKKVKAFLYG